MSGGADDPRLAMQRAAADYGARLDELHAVVREIDEARNAAVRERLEALQSRLSLASAAREALRRLVEARPELFVRPRSQTVAGVKFGWRKKPGRVTLAKNTIQLIRDKLAEKADALLRVRHEVDKAALKSLSGRELALVGAQLEAARDEVEIDAPRSGLERTVAAMVADAAPDPEGGGDAG